MIYLNKLNELLDIIQEFNVRGVNNNTLDEHLRHVSNHMELSEYFNKLKRFTNYYEAKVNQKINQQQNINVDKLYTTTEAAKLLNTTRQTIHNWKIKNVVFRGNRKLIPHQSLLDHIKNTKYDGKI